jgi:hypothetical protein
LATVGALDRDQAVGTVLARLGARRSGWNAADIRGEVEQLIARTGLVTSAGVRIELAEDLTARTLAQCVPLLGDRRGVPEHIRALTSAEVLEVEADLTSRMIARAGAADPAPELVPAQTAAGRAAGPAAGPAGDQEAGAAAGLAPAQRAVVAALAGGRSLLVVEGAAGSGKTTTLAAASRALGARGRRLVVVTPTLKAAGVAARQLRTGAYSAAWLVHQHGYRWDEHGSWTRLRPGHADPATGKTYHGPVPAAVLAAGDVLLVDEAGMLDQDTARALLTIADETGARVALVGDRHQLPAVGRGGVLDLAARWTQPEDRLSLEAVQRFTDPAYADLTLAMRAGDNTGHVFDALLASGHIVIHASETERTQTLAAHVADQVAGGETVNETASERGGERRGERRARQGRLLVVADTREQVAALNAAIRDRLVAAGAVDDRHAVATDGGERIGVGDRVATRRNDRDLDVANRETWTVTATGADGSLTVSGERGDRRLPAGYVAEQVELAYASTVYGAQGETVATAHLVVGEHTGAAAGYVGMTRGRHVNTAHLVAESIDQARTQWVEAFGRDRADLGPGHAARLAELESDRYAPGRDADRVLADLRQAWTAEQDARGVLTGLVGRRDRLAAVVQVRAANQQQLAPYRDTASQARRDAEQARARANSVEEAVDVDAERIAGATRQQWRAEFPAACDAAETVRAGAGRLGQRRGQVRRAEVRLQEWAATWRPVLADLPTAPEAIADTVTNPLLSGARERFQQRLPDYARQVAEQAHPELAQVRADATDADDREQQAARAYHEAALACSDRLAGYGRLRHVEDAEGLLARAEQQISETAAGLRQARARVSALEAEPAIRALPGARLDAERERWRHDRQQAQKQAQQQAPTARPPTSPAAHPGVAPARRASGPPGLPAAEPAARRSRPRAVFVSITAPGGAVLHQARARRRNPQIPSRRSICRRWATKTRGQVSTETPIPPYGG